MTLYDMVEIWKIKNPNKEFFDDIELNPALDKETLFNYLMFEFSEMHCVDHYSEQFHRRTQMFFKIHKYNIDKLCQTMQYEYNPIETVDVHEERILERDIDKNRNLDVTQNEVSDGTSDTDNIQKTITDEDNSQNITTDTDNQQNSSTNRDIDNRVNTTWSDSERYNGTDVNYVSAFNDKESPEIIGYDKDGYPIYKYNDTEHHRDTHNNSTSRSGESDEHTITDDDTSYSLTNNTDTTQTITNNTDTTQDVINNTDVQTHNNTDSTRNDKELTTTDEDVKEITHRSGMEGYTYQSLVEEERKLAQFNIYKWIGRHWTHEMMISVW